MRDLLAFIRLSRPEFLLGGAAMLWVGTRTGGNLGVAGYVLTQTMVSAIQLFANYVNEHFDQDTDAITSRTLFSGGSGVLVSGRLGPRTAIRAATVTGWTAVGLIVGAGFFDWRLAALGAAGLAGAWWYSAPPNRFVSTPIGEAIVALIVAVLVPVTGAVLATPADWPMLISLVIPLFLAAWALLLSLDAADERADSATGKRTLWVRIGAERGRALHLALILGVVAGLLILGRWRPTPSTAAGLAVAPLLGVAHAGLHRLSSARARNVMAAAGVVGVGALAFALGLGTL